MINPIDIPQGTDTVDDVSQYIKSWITLWDMQRLTGDEVKTIIEVIRPDYDEDPNISSPNSENSDPYSE